MRYNVVVVPDHNGKYINVEVEAESELEAMDKVTERRRTQGRKGHVYSAWPKSR